MTIDEAIRHCEEVAWENDRKAMCIEEAYQTTEQENCEQCAADHRQLAEWLTELKDLREENKVLMSECDRLIKEKGELNKLKEKAVLDICRREARLKEAKRLLKQVCCDFSNDKAVRLDHLNEALQFLKLIGEDDNESQN